MLHIKVCFPICIGEIAVCFLLQKRVKDVISPIVFEAAYSLGEHMIERGKEGKELPALKPILRWKKGQKIAQRNQVRFGLCSFPRRPVGELTAEVDIKGDCQALGHLHTVDFLYNNYCC